MDKQTLIAHLKLSADSIDKLLEAAQLSPELGDFQPEQVEMLAAICQLAAEKKVKTYKEAAELYRKPLREKQLVEIAQQYSITAERVPEILGAMKLKPETITDAQVDAFVQVCIKLQSGASLSDALPKPARIRKGTTQSMPEFVDDASAGGNGAIELVEQGQLMSPVVTSAQQATLRDIAEALAPEAVPNLTDEMIEAAETVSADIKQTAKAIFFDEAIKQLQQQNHDPQRAVELFRQRKQGRNS
jgi:hypothetical protein